MPRVREAIADAQRQHRSAQAHAGSERTTQALRRSHHRALRLKLDRAADRQDPHRGRHPQETRHSRLLEARLRRGVIDTGHRGRSASVPAVRTTRYCPRSIRRSWYPPPALPGCPNGPSFPRYRRAFSDSPSSVLVRRQPYLRVIKSRRSSCPRGPPAWMQGSIIMAAVAVYGFQTAPGKLTDHLAGATRRASDICDASACRPSTCRPSRALTSG